LSTNKSVTYYAPDLRREGALSVDGRRLSACPYVCPSRASTQVENWKAPEAHIQIGTMEAHDPGDPWTRFKVKRSKIKVTGPTTADTLKAPYLPNAKAYELQTW